ncbi:MAG: FG-GAP repeat domain-containing protein [Limisphaerales bacterium]
MHLSGYRFSMLLALFVSAATTAKAATFVWTEQEIDTIEIGYGLALTDVDGDGKRDILLADKKTIQWYQNPSWQKHIIARDLTVRDNVCIAARDIDGDGRCEVRTMEFFGNHSGWSHSLPASTAGPP